MQRMEVLSPEKQSAHSDNASTSANFTAAYACYFIFTLFELVKEFAYQRAIRFPAHERDQTTTQGPKKGHTVERVAEPAPALA